MQVARSSSPDPKTISCAEPGEGFLGLAAWAAGDLRRRSNVPRRCAACTPRNLVDDSDGTVNLADMWVALARRAAPVGCARRRCEPPQRGDWRPASHRRHARCPRRARPRARPAPRRGTSRPARSDQRATSISDERRRSWPWRRCAAPATSMPLALLDEADVTSSDRGDAAIQIAGEPAAATGRPQGSPSATSRILRYEHLTTGATAFSPSTALMGCRHQYLCAAGTARPASAAAALASGDGTASSRFGAGACRPEATTCQRRWSCCCGPSDAPAGWWAVRRGRPEWRACGVVRRRHGRGDAAPAHRLLERAQGTVEWEQSLADPAGASASSKCCGCSTASCEGRKIAATVVTLNTFRPTPRIIIKRQGPGGCRAPRFATTGYLITRSSRVTLGHLMGRAPHPTSTSSRPHPGPTRTEPTSSSHPTCSPGGRRRRHRSQRSSSACRSTTRTSMRLDHHNGSGRRDPEGADDGPRPVGITGMYLRQVREVGLTGS